MNEQRSDEEGRSDSIPPYAGGTRTYRPLRRIGAGRLVAGVAGGLAEHLDVDVSMVRLGFVALTLAGGIAVPAYLACWLLIPEEGTEGTLADDLLYRAGDFFEEAESRLQGRAR